MPSDSSSASALSWLLTFKTVATTLIIAGSGAGAAYLLGAPAPFLVGPSLAVASMGLAGVAVSVPPLLRNVCFVIIGLSMGAGVTPDVVESARQWPLSFVILGLSLLAIVLAGRWILQNHWRFDPMTALLSVVPGHLSYVLGLSADTSGDLATISVIQSIRVLALTILVPFAVVLIGIETGTSLVAMDIMTLPMFGVSIVLSFVGGYLLNRLRLPAAYLIAGLVWSTGSHITGSIDGTVSPYVAIPAFITMGALIGTRFYGVTRALLKRAFLAGTTVTLAAFVISALAAWSVSLFIDTPLSHLLVAFAPGGVETMAAMAISLNADPAFVAAHHVMRLFILTFLAPIMLGLARRSAGPADNP
tara:strand:- start:3896 stop:4978 length:1083 start_codon:yes stop_codon:yes gene_type:complete